LRWEKLLWNVPFNGLSVALGGVLTDRLVGEPDSLALVVALMDEVRAIAKADGAPLSKAQAAQMVENTRLMTPYRTSMLIDSEAGREMEVQAIFGEPLVVARRHKVAVPILTALYRMLSFFNAGRTAGRNMPS
jgi:2-dehydropantoate 2-reductase